MLAFNKGPTRSRSFHLFNFALSTLQHLNINRCRLSMVYRRADLRPDTMCDLTRVRYRCKHNDHLIDKFCVVYHVKQSRRYCLCNLKL